MSIEEFIKARLDEWESLARQAFPHETGSRDEGQPLEWTGYRRGPGNAQFGLRHVATLRAIVEECTLLRAVGVAYPDEAGPESAEDILRLMAADWRAHSDYLAEWAPSDAHRA